MTQSQTIMSGGNAAFIEGLYEAYLADPQSVDPEWRSYFDELRGGAQGLDGREEGRRIDPGQGLAR